MKKSFLLTSFIITLVMASCKKEDAISKINPTTESIAPADPSKVKIEGTSTTPDATEKPAPIPANGKYPQMSFNEKEFDFGDITQGEKVSHTFTFTNTGDADLLISDAKASCGCTVPEYPKDAIKPGKTGKLKVTFDSAGKSGETKKTITITCNTAQGMEQLAIKTNIQLPK